MKASHLLPLLGFAGLALAAYGEPPVLPSLQLEPRLYVFRTADFQSIALSGHALTGENRAIAVTPPATIAFDRTKLSLDGPSFTWTGQGVPAQFSPVPAPVIGLTPGQPAALLSELPTQYFEKRPDGAFALRETPRDSPEIPRYQITFRVDPAATGDASLRVAADAEVASVRTREKLPGVDLDVGKPVTATFKDHVEFSTRPGDWSALLLRSPNGSDYSALLLLRLSPATGPVAAGDPSAPPRVEVVFSHPEDFSDAADGPRGSDFGRDNNLDLLRDHLVEQAPRYLAKGQTLRITVTDVDLAGEVEPWHTRGMNDVRIVKEVYPPRINLDFRLTDASGAVLKEGQRHLTDVMFMSRISPIRTEARQYEYALLDDWLRSEFPRSRKK